MGALLQIHFHNRPGGVTTVMAEYARAFVSGPDGGQVTAVCSDHGSGVLENAGVAVLGTPLCDYHRFRSRRAFERDRRRIALLLRNAMQSLPRPLFVVAHNTNLGKNCALSAAWADVCAEQQRGVRCFTVVHDRAEEGRVDLLAGIAALERLGVPMWTLLYPRPAAHQYLSPSRDVCAALSHAGFAAAAVPNPVPIPGAGTRGERIREFVDRGTERECGGGVRPVVFYPARCVARKNIIEAVLVGTVCMGHSLWLGARGTSPDDRRLVERLESFCRERGLPVLFDVGAVASVGASRVGAPTPSFGDLYAGADVCLSTAVLEGFGYALYEPWVRGKALVGRVPQGFSHYAKLRFGHLYDTLDIPTSWVDRREFVSRARRLARCAGSSSRQARLPEGLLDAEHVDFALLGARAQLSVLARLMEDPLSLERVLVRRGARTVALPGPFSRAAIDSVGAQISTNAARVRRHLNREACAARLWRAFSSVSRAAKPRPTGDWGLGKLDMRSALMLSAW